MISAACSLVRQLCKGEVSTRSERANRFLGTFSNSKNYLSQCAMSCTANSQTSEFRLEHPIKNVQNRRLE